MSVVQHWHGLLPGFLLALVVAAPVNAQQDETPETGQNVPTEPGGETPAPTAANPNAQPEGVPQAPPEAPPEGTPQAPPEAPPGAEDAPPQVEGPLFVVAPEGTPHGSAHGGAHGDAQEVRGIYRASDQTFANVLWWWVLLIAVIAGLGYGAWMIWGRRTPRPPSGR